MTFEVVPPPFVAPAQPRADELGLPRGLRVECYNDQFRCAECSKMQRRGTEGVWVPDGLRRSDPRWAVEESARLNAYNGEASFWCLPCAMHFSSKPPSPGPALPHAHAPRRKFLGIF